jgi:hypothetical protein
MTATTEELDTLYADRDAPAVPGGVVIVYLCISNGSRVSPAPFHTE